jgi:hypothetical protein
MGHTKHHMKHKHHRAKGGRVEYDAQGSNEMKEVHEKKHGGGVHGHKGKHRIHKKRGGGIGSDLSPFSSAGRGMNNSPAAKGGSPHVGFTGAHGK